MGRSLNIPQTIPENLALQVFPETPPALGRSWSRRSYSYFCPVHYLAMSILITGSFGLGLSAGLSPHTVEAMSCSAFLVWAIIAIWARHFR